MLASEAIRVLEDLIATFGDLPIGGGYIVEDRPLRSIVALDDEGRQAHDPAYATCFFLE